MEILKVAGIYKPVSSMFSMPQVKIWKLWKRKSFIRVYNHLRGTHMMAQKINVHIDMK